MRNIHSFWQSFSLLLSTLGRVIKLAWSVSPWLYTAQFVINLISGLIPLFSAYLAGAVVSELARDLTAKAPSLNHLYELVIALAVAQFVSTQLGYLENYLDDIYALNFDGYIQSEMIAQFSRLDQTYYDDTEFNNKLNKINQNTFAMRNLSGQSLTLLSNVVQVVATAVALAAFEPLLVPVILVTLAPVIWISASASLKRWKFWDKKGEDIRMAWHLKNTLMDTPMIREIKLYGLTNWLSARWRTKFEIGRRGQIEIERKAQQLRAVAGILDAIVQVGVQIWLIALVIGKGVAGLGSFVFYRQAVQNFATVGATGVRTLQQMQENSLYVNDYFDYMDLKPRLKITDSPVKLTGDSAPNIAFENVSFRYVGAKKWALRHVNLTIDSGQDIAIIGENGAGKTTFVKLLMRLYDPTEGRITVDGIDLREIDLDSWSKRIGVLFQDFNRYNLLTLSENIQTGKINQPADSDTITEALNKAGGASLLSELPEGMQQTLSNYFDKGVDISGGQWQRVALARAFYRNAPILVLDEPTSAIDAKGEYEIFQQIARTQADKTTIIISHRFSTVRNANHIIVFDKGTILEAGSHDELMELGGQYHKLFELQAEGYR